MLNRWQSTIVDAQGNIQPFAELTILNEETQGPAAVYHDRAGSSPISGNVVADESGYAYFYARGGRYRIQSNDLNIDWRHVALGSAATADVVQLTGGSTANVMSQKAVSDQLFGVGQEWGSVTRSPGITYTNTTGRTIMCVITFSGYDPSSTSTVIVDNIGVSQYKNQAGSTSGGPTETQRSAVTFVVPSGGTYKIELGNGHIIDRFRELR